MNDRERAAVEFLLSICQKVQEGDVLTEELLIELSDAMADIEAIISDDDALKILRVEGKASE